MLNFLMHLCIIRSVGESEYFSWVLWGAAVEMDWRVQEVLRRTIPVKDKRERR